MRVIDLKELSTLFNEKSILVLEKSKEHSLNKHLIKNLQQNRKTDIFAKNTI